MGPRFFVNRQSERLYEINKVCSIFVLPMPRLSVMMVIAWED